MTDHNPTPPSTTGPSASSPVPQPQPQPQGGHYPGPSYPQPPYPAAGTTPPAPGAYPGTGMLQPPQPGAYPGAVGPMPPQGGAYPVKKTGGFFSALFDFSFTKYVTLTAAKIVYILAIVIHALIALSILINTFAVVGAIQALNSYTSYSSESSGLASGFFVFIIAFLFAGIYFIAAIVFTRLLLERQIAVVQAAKACQAIESSLDEDK